MIFSIPVGGRNLILFCTGIISSENSKIKQFSDAVSAPSIIGGCISEFINSRYPLRGVQLHKSIRSVTGRQSGKE